MDSRPGRLRYRDLTIGGAAGLAGGLLGVGGGFLMVPLQVLWARTTQRRASGTSLAAIVPIGIVGAGVYYFGGSAHQLDLPVAVFVMIGSSAGALVGAGLASRVPERILKMLVAALMVVAAVSELRNAIFGGSTVLEAASTPGVGPVGFLLLVVSGAFIGTISGLTGVGGGVLLVPTLVFGFGIGQRVAQGTSLLAILPTAGVGAVVHQRHGDLDSRAAGWMSLGGVPGALLGAVLALWLPQRVLAGLFGLLLAAMAVRMWPRRDETTPA
ncbi:MAG: sulfite exporter TauE/SafE family protein [Candidatus Dormiibacterota bacterium]